jgi:predicted nucleic acid-binding protein
MYPLSKAIFDNTVFNYIIRLQSVDLSNIVKLLIQEVLVPQTIVSEMEGWGENPKYAARIGFYTNQIRRNQFYKFCTSYNPVILEEAQRHIDKGEADAVAQSDKTNVLLFVTDDKACQDYIKDSYPNIRLHSTFFLIALAHFQGLLPNSEAVLQEFHQINKVENMGAKSQSTYRKMLRSEASEASRLLGFSFDKKQISFLTSLKNRI